MGDWSPSQPHTPKWTDSKRFKWKKSWSKYRPTSTKTYRLLIDVVWHLTAGSVRIGTAPFPLDALEFFFYIVLGWLHPLVSLPPTTYPLSDKQTFLFVVLFYLRPPSTSRRRPFILKSFKPVELFLLFI